MSSYLKMYGMFWIRQPGLWDPALNYQTGSTAISAIFAQPQIRLVNLAALPAVLRWEISNPEHVRNADTSSLNLKQDVQTAAILCEN